MKVSSEGAHSYSPDLGQGSGTGQSPASSQTQQDADQPQSGSFASPVLGETPRRQRMQRGRDGRRRKGSHAVQQKGEISRFWIYRGLDLAEHMLNQINTINIYELSSSN